MSRATLVTGPSRAAHHFLYAVTGARGNLEATGLVYDLSAAATDDDGDRAWLEPVDRFGRPVQSGFADGIGFAAPHDLAVRAGGGDVYETELSRPYR